MSGTVSSLTAAVAVCPICAEEYNDVSNLPRRLPCCEQHICEVCLDKIIEGRRFPCPVCRVDVNIPGGPRSLPKDMTVLRFLDVLKTRRDVLQTSTFRDIPARRSTRPPTVNVLGASSAELSQLQKKLDQVSLRMKSLSDSEGNIKKSEKKATELINQRFDDMVEELQHRRGILLSQVKSKADRELKSTRRALESHKTLQDELKSAITSGHSASSLQTLEDVGAAERVGVSFTEVHMEQLLSSIRSAGQIRVVSYSPTQRPSYVTADELYNSVRFTPDDSPEAPQADVNLTIRGKDVIGPRLEFDHNTASADVQISPGMVSNTRPDPAPQDTGCRLQSKRRALTLRPLPLKRGQVGVFSTRVVFTVKKLLKENKMIWETSVTGAPVDADWSQPTGLSVRVASCSTHKQQLCLKVRYDGKLLTDVPLTKYQVGVSRDVNLCIVIDRDTNKIHVVDTTDVKVVTTTEASLDRPLWVLTYVEQPLYCEMTSELISGRDLTLTPEIKHVISQNGVPINHHYCYSTRL